MSFSSIYIHIPFCVKKCNYCTFFSVERGNGDVKGYVNAVLSELVQEEVTSLSTVYIGGGTPTSLTGETLSILLKGIQGILPLNDVNEYSIEANPGTLTKEKLELLRSSGINRLSLGFQSCNNIFLKMLGRIHTNEDNKISFRKARQCGFSNINIDMIYGIPDQEIFDLSIDIDTVLSLSPEHLSFYELSYEKNTPLYTEYISGKISRIDESKVLEMQILIEEKLAMAGYKRYEVSSYAIPGLKCLHNMNYWEGNDYGGVGAGAVSLRRGEREKRTENIDEYISNIRNNKVPVVFSEIVDNTTKERELIMTGLRMTKGLNNNDFFRKTGGYLEKYRNTIQRLQDKGYVLYRNGQLKATPKGFPVLDEIIIDFF